MKYINKTILTIILFFICTAAANAANEYDIKNISDGLRKNSNLVIRKLVQEFEVRGKGEAVLEYVLAVTIFGKDEQHNGDITLLYNTSFTDVEYLEGTLYDASGEEIKELDNDDIRDYSDYSDYTLFSDNRIIRASLYHNIFPYTIEFRYKITKHESINWPTWYSRTSRDPVELSRFVVAMPENQELRYFCNSQTPPVIVSDGSYKIYTWEASNLQEMEEDAVTANIKDFADYVSIAPGDFVLEGFRGSMITWQDFGKWFYGLAATQGNLSQSAKNEITKQYNETADAKEKIKNLYTYMQKKTRYVNISLGIGGWQPLQAQFVHDKGYGDCKALTNYMSALLNIAGIKSYPALIATGEEYHTLREFPSNQFNHVILFVPLEDDTLWLECTSQSYPAGFIGWGNENRFALLVTPDGGTLVNTPLSRPEDNYQFRKAEINLLSSGNAQAGIHISWGGCQSSYNYELIAKAPANLRYDNLVNSMSIPDINLKTYNINDQVNGVFSLEIDAQLPKYGSVTGSRIFFNPNLLERRTYIPKQNTERKAPVRFNYPYLDIDTIIYNIPRGFVPESIPQEVVLETSFGKFNSKCSVEEDKIIYVRRYELSDYKISPEHYSDYRDFASEIVKADRMQIVLSGKK